MSSVLDPQTASEMLGMLSLVIIPAAIALGARVVAVVRLHRRWQRMRRSAAAYRAARLAAPSARRAA